MRLTMELYDALVAAGVEETLARKAASVVLAEEDKEHLATKEFVREAEVRIIKWTVGTGIAIVAIMLGVLPRLIG